jgi:hypothetical protein
MALANEANQGGMTRKQMRTSIFFNKSNLHSIISTISSQETLAVS